MTDKDHIRTSTINFRDWIRGEGEFSEEALRKARDEFFTKMGQRLHQKMLEAMEAALGPDHDASPDARAQSPSPDHAGLRDATTGEPGGGAGTGKLPEPAAWAAVYRGQVEFASDDRKHCEEWTSFQHRGPAAFDIIPLYRVTVAVEPTLTAEEREVIVWCAELLDELESSKGDTLRSLLERLTQPPAGT